MIWSTKTTYVDRETGEEITKRHVEKGDYIITHKEITKKINTNHYGTYGTIHITATCERSKQCKIW